LIALARELEEVQRYLEPMKKAIIAQEGFSVCEMTACLGGKYEWVRVQRRRTRNHLLMLILVLVGESCRE